jgi:light-regulated signal transduction histidine kinase (bacteriophytochrome)
MKDRLLLADDEALEVELRVKTVDNEWKWFRTRSKVFSRDANGKVLQIISASYYIDKLKQAQNRNKLLNTMVEIKNRELELANRELNIFSQVAANEYRETFRNLYNVLEFTIMGEGMKLTNSGRANMRRVQAGLQKVKMLTEDIIMYTAVHTIGEEVMIDMNDILAQVLQEFGQDIAETGTEINMVPLPLISGEPQLILLLMRHLLSNAIKFRSMDRTPELNFTHSAVIGIKGNNEPLIPDRKYVVISIADNGIGFDPWYERQIFTMFFKLHEKRKYKGSGLGLSICKKIMEIHQGHINAETVPYEGSKFNCYFPVEKIKA